MPGVIPDFATFRDAFASSIEGVDAGALGPDTVFRRLEAWDSLAVLSVLAMADAEFGVSLAAAELKAVETLGQLHALVARKAGAA